MTPLDTNTFTLEANNPISHWLCTNVVQIRSPEFRTGHTLHLHPPHWKERLSAGLSIFTPQLPGWIFLQWKLVSTTLPYFTFRSCLLSQVCLPPLHVTPLPPLHVTPLLTSLRYASLSLLSHSGFPQPTMCLTFQPPCSNPLSLRNSTPVLLLCVCTHLHQVHTHVHGPILSWEPEVGCWATWPMSFRDAPVSELKLCSTGLILEIWTYVYTADTVLTKLSLQPSSAASSKKFYLTIFAGRELFPLRGPGNAFGHL